MDNYTDNELELLLGDLESDLAERKASFQGGTPTRAREVICAFANDLPDYGRSGVLFIGANDDGTPSGIEITDQFLQQLADMKTDGNSLPPPSMTVQKRNLAGIDMAVVTVAPSDSPPVRYRGRIWVRVGPRRAIATSQDERILNEKRRHLDHTFDSRPLPGSTVSDLNRTKFEDEYLPRAFAPDALEGNERTYEQRLAATKMIVSIDDPIPTVAGMLLLGISPRDYIPGAYVQFLKIRGAELSDPIDDEFVVDGAVDDIIRGIEEKLRSHNRISVQVASPEIEQRTELVPFAALQQLIRNAVLHRNYEGTNAAIRVTWFDDRIEITSPGGPYGAVNATNFAGAGVVDYRNPVLAEALRVLGFVNRFGVGIATAQAALKENGNPPAEFQVLEGWVHCLIRVNQ